VKVGWLSATIVVVQQFEDKYIDCWWSSVRKAFKDLTTPTVKSETVSIGKNCKLVRTLAVVACFKVTPGVRLGDRKTLVSVSGSGTEISLWRVIRTHSGELMCHHCTCTRLFTGNNVQMELPAVAVYSKDNWFEYQTSYRPCCWKFFVPFLRPSGRIMIQYLQIRPPPPSSQIITYQTSSSHLIQRYTIHEIERVSLNKHNAPPPASTQTPTNAWQAILVRTNGLTH
jgi:hypothetical protein